MARIRTVTDSNRGPVRDRSHVWRYRMAESHTLSERYARIGAALVETEPSLASVRDSHATIVYLASELT